ncbi:MAG TPA: cytochrome c biogenesis protein ResB [Symbiobacteriaceae bacterium]|jgi:cytochrome c biogenesis protein
MEEKGGAPEAELELKSADAEAAEAETEAAVRPVKGFLEQTWDFFASVPVATVLLFLIAAASVAGTLIEQEGQYSDWRPPLDFYPDRYGKVFGMFLFKTGMTRMYTSWWYLTLLFMLGASLIICSLERFVPLWKAVQRPNHTPDQNFVKRLKNRFDFVAADATNGLDTLATQLKARRYFVVREGDRLFADKGRWGRWGPYITHIGLLLVLAGAMMRAIPGVYMDQSVWVRDGSIVRVPGGSWYVRNDKFTAEFYASGQPKSYTTEAVVIDNGQEVKKATISMNNPLSYRWIELYQSSYRQEMGKATAALIDKTTGKPLGTFDVDLLNPADTYTVAGYTLKINQYFTDFTMDGNGKPANASNLVQNPGILFDITPPNGGKAFSTWYFILYPEMSLDKDIPIKFATTKDPEVSSTTGLKVKKDLGLPVIYLGLFIVTLGVFATFYLAHRRYWALVDGGKIVVGGWTNRNQGGLGTEMAILATLLDPTTNPKKDEMEGEER